MDEIQKIVFEIADRCSRRRIPVNDMLAAFVAKSVILESPDRFQLDSALKPEDVEELVNLAVDRLGKEDDPSSKRCACRSLLTRHTSRGRSSSKRTAPPRSAATA